ncbi:hypothetical protein [Rhizobium leguminosarum]|jgi:hypothetical protein|uniref:hypothetical protein n=1 Tax=Rhizobium leguminosarum TaxID=384 RepID=UPI00161E75B1|nr:hypothetical protein [Rhizobium leguminosarum]MBB4345161.1 hypothetical protein [Rhizobium leguminosarum]MBB6298232.1 hypothetical protein [Rhizobium leguminosarum]
MNDKQTLTLEVGKYYRTRDGKKAYAGYVMAESPFNGSKPLYPVSGWVDGEAMPQCWNLDGSLHEPENEHKFDLVAEWIEPRRIKGWVAVGAETGSHVRCTHIHPSKEAAIRYLRGPSYNDNTFAVIEIDVLEGTGLEGEVA